MDLPTAAAGHAGDYASAFFGAGAVASFAEFQSRQADFCVDSGSRLFKTQFHVIAQVLAALGTVARAASAEDILETKEIAEDILEFVENALINAAIKASA